MSNYSRYTFAIIIFITFILTGFIYFFVTSRDNIQDDNAIYIKMAESPNVYYLQPYPFRNRILTPVIVYLLPMEINLGFQIVTFISLNLTALILFFLMKNMGLSSVSSFLMVIIYLFSYGSIHSLSNPFLSDPLTYLFLSLLFYLFLKGTSELVLSICLFAGTLNRETTLFLIPSSYYYLSKKSSRLSPVLRTFLVWIIPIIGFLYLNFVPNNDSQQNFNNTMLLIPQIIRDHITKNALFEVYSTFGATWILFILNINKSMNRLIRPNIIFIIFILSQLVFATDEGRMLSFLFPLVIPTAAYEFERTLQRFKNKYWRIIILIALLFAEIGSQINWKWVIIPERYLRYFLVILSTIIVLVIAFINRIKITKASNIQKQIEIT